jgi:monoamine oxidase
LQRYDALIIGAGFSGLAAATALKASGKSVLVLEARDRPGGRVKPGSIAGVTIDMGGMWVGAGHKRLQKLVEAHSLATYPTYLDGEAVIEMGGKMIRCPREDFAKALPLTAKLDFAMIEGKLKRLINSVVLADPSKTLDAARLDAMSLGEWMRRHARTHGFRLVLTLITRSVFCAEPDELSFLHFLFYVKAGGGLDAMVSAEANGVQARLVVGGLHQLAQKMADDLGPVLVDQAPVMAVEQAQDGVQVVTPRGVYSAQRLIVAVSPALGNSMSFAPMLPHARDALHQRMPMGACIKAWVAYDRPFWRDAGLNAFVSSDTSGFSPAFDVSPPDGPGLIAGFFDAREASIWSARTTAQRREEVLKLLTRALGREASKPIDYAETDWTTERWSNGCYAAFAPPGVWTQFGLGLRAPVGRIHWAGTETATEANGYVEGALQAGERAAAEVRSALT